MGNKLDTVIFITMRIILNVFKIIYLQNAKCRKLISCQKQLTSLSWGQVTKAERWNKSRQKPKDDGEVMSLNIVVADVAAERSSQFVADNLVLQQIWVFEKNNSANSHFEGYDITFSHSFLIFTFFWPWNKTHQSLSENLDEEIKLSSRRGNPGPSQDFTFLL
jgi:hypothetical protein